MGKYTFAEILSQPETWENVVHTFTGQWDDWKQYLADDSNEVAIFIGCGTSYYLAQSSASVFSEIAGIEAKSSPASDAFLFPETLFVENSKRHLPFLISRSGTTTEVLWAADFIQTNLKKDIIGISCRSGSTLTQNANHTLLVTDADEKSVVMTRSFTSMLLLVQLLAATQAPDDKFREELYRLPEIGHRILEKYQTLPEEIVNHEGIQKYVYLGQGPLYGLANESMLKIKEMSLSTSEAYHTLEFRHGPKSMVDEDMLVTFFLSDSAFDTESNLVKEVKELGGKTLTVCEHATPAVKEYSDYLVELGSGLSDYARLILYMPITQLLGYHAAVAKNLDPDKPTNLTQVVTL